MDLVVSSGISKTLSFSKSPKSIFEVVQGLFKATDVQLSLEGSNNF